MKVAIYCRVSTSSQYEDEIPILGQLEECRKYAAERKWEVVRVYEEAGHGWDDTRPAFQEMYNEAKKTPRPFDIILTWRSNRLFRSVEHRLAYTRILRRHGIRFVSLHEPEMEGASGQLMETMMAAIDEYYCKQVSEDTLRGLKLIASQGYSTGGRPPTGYRNVRVASGLKANGEPIMRTRWEVDPETAPRVQQAFQMCLEGHTNEEIARTTRVTTAKNGLSYLFRNRAYLGERIYNTTRRTDKKTVRLKNDDGAIVRVPNSHPAIISQEIFDAVGKILDAKRPNIGQRKYTPRDYVLSGILWCPEHDQPYTGQPSGYKADYYACAERKKHGKSRAPCEMLKKDRIEAFVLDKLRTKIFTRERIRAGLEWIAREKIRNRKEDNTEIIKLMDQIRDVDSELGRLQEAITQGVNLDALIKPINDRQAQKKELERQLSIIESAKQRALNMPTITDEEVERVLKAALQAFETSNPRELKNHIADYVEMIEVRGRELKIFYTFAPGETISDYKRPLISYQKRPQGVSGSNYWFASFLLDTSIFPRTASIHQ